MPNADLLSKIIVTADFDSHIDEQQRVIVNLTNSSDKTFSGNVFVYVDDSFGKEVGSDVVIVEKLKPGQSSFANIFATPVSDPVFFL